MLQIATSKNKPDWEGNEPSRSQNIVPRSGRGGRRKLPLAFTEHGALMAASVLNTPRAVDMRVYFVRAFVLLSRTIANHPELTQKLEELERLVDRHDEHIAQILETIRQLMAPQPVSERRIGFGTQQN